MTEKKNRTIHYSFKATPEEDAIIQKKMKTFGIKNQSAFIRAMALNGYVLKLDLPELHAADKKTSHAPLRQKQTPD